MFDIKGEYKITLPPNPVFSGNRKIGKYFNRKIFLQGHTYRRDTDTGRQARPCWLSLPRSMMMHHKGNEHSQAYSLTGSYHCRHRRTGTPTQGRPLTPSLSRSYSYRKIPPYHWRPLTQATGSPLLALAPSVYDDAPQRK